VWCTSNHNTDGARTCEVGGSWCSDASSCGKTNTGIRELNIFADINYEFFLIYYLSDRRNLPFGINIRIFIIKENCKIEEFE
jgi:hypothetical protein